MKTISLIVFFMTCLAVWESRAEQTSTKTNPLKSKFIQTCSDSSGAELTVDDKDFGNCVSQAKQKADLKKAKQKK